MTRRIGDEFTEALYTAENWAATRVVELTGIEPVTSCMPCKRSAN